MRRGIAALALAAVSAAAFPSPVQAQDSRLEAGITILRDVPYRSATRLGWPADPFRVRTTPAPEVLGALDEGRVITREITDLEAARITANIPLGQFTGGPGQTSNLSTTIVRSTSRIAGSAGMQGITGIGDVGLAAGSAVRSGTSGIAGTIRGALGLPNR